MKIYRIKHTVIGCMQNNHTLAIFILHSPLEKTWVSVVHILAGEDRELLMYVCKSAGIYLNVIIVIGVYENEGKNAFHAFNL